MLRLALEKVDFLPPDRVTDDASILTLKSLVLEPMVRWEEGRTQAGLFDRFLLSPDGCQWTFTLRNNAHYHDSTPVKASDAQAFIESILDARDMFGMPWSYARYLKGARFHSNDAVLSISTPTPFPDLPEILSEFYLPKLAPDGTPTIGTGSWRVQSYTQHDSVVLSHMDGRLLQCIAMPNAEQRLHALQAGEIDIASHLERLKNPQRLRDNFTWHEQATTLSVIAYMNGREGPFRDPHMRLAANLAIDREKLITDVMDGLGLPAKTIVSPFHNGMTSEQARIAFDPDQASNLVAQTDAPKTIRLRAPQYMPERAPEIAQFVAESLENVGFKVTLDIAKDRPEYARELGNKNMGDLAIFDSSPHSTFRVLDDKISSRSRAVWWQGVEDEMADQLFAEARTTLDDRQRSRAYGKTLAYLGTHPHWLYLFHPIDCMAHAPTLSGLSLDPKGILRIT